MGTRYIKCSFNKDADHHHPDPREKTYTYATNDDSLTAGDLAEVAEVAEGRNAGKRIKVLATDLLKPTFACVNVRKWVPPAAESLEGDDASDGGADFGGE